MNDRGAISANLFYSHSNIVFICFLQTEKKQERMKFGFYLCAFAAVLSSLSPMVKGDDPTVKGDERVTNVQISKAGKEFHTMVAPIIDDSLPIYMGLNSQVKTAKQGIRGYLKLIGSNGKNILTRKVETLKKEDVPKMSLGKTNAGGFSSYVSSQSVADENANDKTDTEGNPTGSAIIQDTSEGNPADAATIEDTYNVASVAVAKRDAIPIEDNDIGSNVRKGKDTKSIVSGRAKRLAHKQVLFPELGGVFLWWDIDVDHERNDGHGSIMIGYDDGKGEVRTDIAFVG